jgi:hypothetical protein
MHTNRKTATGQCQYHTAAFRLLAPPESAHNEKSVDHAECHGLAREVGPAGSRSTALHMNIKDPFVSKRQKRSEIFFRAINQFCGVLAVITMKLV